MPELLDRGINFFNADRYFEAHEVWEEMWRDEKGPLRFFYQGLIQAAVGLHHLSRGNVRGARAQLEKALAKLEKYTTPTVGIDVVRFSGDLKRKLQDLPHPSDVHIRIHNVPG